VIKKTTRLLYILSQVIQRPRVYDIFYVKWYKHRAFIIYFLSRDPKTTRLLYILSQVI